MLYIFLETTYNKKCIIIEKKIHEYIYSEISSPISFFDKLCHVIYFWKSYRKYNIIQCKLFKNIISEQSYRDLIFIIS